MNNTLGKTLVLIHTMLSVAAVVWAFLLFFQGRDLGYMEPRKVVQEYDKEGNPKPNSTIRYPSEIDKSSAALVAARNTRDLIYGKVQPAIDNLRKTEPYLPKNSLAYKREMKKLKDYPEKMEVLRLKEGGLFLEVDLGQPVFEDKAVEGVSKSYQVYDAELKDLQKKILDVEKEIQIVAKDIRTFTAELTGTDEQNKYVHPGLYQMTDMEFKAQAQLKIEIDEIKPHQTKAVEQARLFGFRRSDLEATLLKLQAVPAKNQKKQ